MDLTTGVSGVDDVEGVEGDEELSQAADEFDQWRAQRVSKREPIPARLWERAMSLSKRHGVGRVARLLHLNGGDLKRRLALASAVQPKRGVKFKAVQFVEMVAHPTVRTQMTPTEPGRAECVADLINARSMKMHVELSGRGVSGLSELCKTFWSVR
jgi:hypothetical protein